MAKTSTHILRRLNDGKIPEPKLDVTDPFAADRERVKQAMERARLKEGIKSIYLELLHPGAGETLCRTGAWHLGCALRTHGPKVLLTRDGRLIDIAQAGVTPQTVDCLFQSAQETSAIASISSGTELLTKAKAYDYAVSRIAAGDKVPIMIRHEYIHAVGASFEQGDQGRIVLQEIVDRATRTGRFRSEPKRHSWSRGDDPIDSGLAYLAMRLFPNPPQSSHSCGLHPAISLLGAIVRSLPQGQAFDVTPPQAPVAKAAVAAGAGAVSAQKQAEIDAAIGAFFGKPVKKDLPFTPGGN
jgi:hypothetical protein